VRPACLWLSRHALCPDWPPGAALPVTTHVRAYNSPADSLSEATPIPTAPVRTPRSTATQSLSERCCRSGEPAAAGCLTPPFILRWTPLAAPGDITKSLSRAHRATIIPLPVHVQRGCQPQLLADSRSHCHSFTGIDHCPHPVLLRVQIS
jgi:hypothetical protein